MVLKQSDLIDSFKICLVVGTILSLINQYDVIFGLSFSTKDTLRIVFNYIVPFSVASISRWMYIKKNKS